MRARTARSGRRACSHAGRVAGLLGGTGRPRGLLRLGGGLKPLRAILSEYVDLVEARRRREDYARANPVVAKIFDVIDACAQDSEQR